MNQEKEKGASTLRQKLQKTYLQTVLEKGEPPKSVFSFCLENEIDEESFYREFSSLEGLGASIFADAFDEVVRALKASPEYPEFLVRERFLATYYAWFEKALSLRSYALIQLNPRKLPSEWSSLNQWKRKFKSWADECLNQGVESGEIPGRSKLNNTYPDMLWLQFLFLNQFWLKDESKGFEKTDEAVEKNLRLAFDLIEKNAVDSAFDLGKFIIQQMR